MRPYVRLLWPLVTDRVAWSVGLSVCAVCHTVESCKNGWTDRDAVWVENLGGPREPCIRWGPEPPMARGNFDGRKGRPIVKYRDTLRSFMQKLLKRLRCRLGWGLGWAQGTMYYMGVQIPHAKGQFWGKEEPIVTVGTFCHEVCKNGWTDQFAVWILDSGGWRKHKFNHIRQVAPICPQYRWTVHVRHAVAWRPVVKLLWPLVTHLEMSWGLSWVQYVYRVSWRWERCCSERWRRHQWAVKSQHSVGYLLTAADWHLIAVQLLCSHVHDECCIVSDDDDDDDNDDDNNNDNHNNNNLNITTTTTTTTTTICCHQMQQSNNYTYIYVWRNKVPCWTALVQ